MTEDKRIEWCKKHCIDISGNTYIKNLNFNDQKFIDINADRNGWLCLKFNEKQLPEFINFRVKKSSVFKTNIDIEKCPHLKSWQGLPIDNIGNISLGSELENIDLMPMCNTIDHIFIEDEQENLRTNKRLRIKQWQKFQSEVLDKLQWQNPNINISDYQDGIEWLAIHDRSFYKKFLERKVLFDDGKIIFNGEVQFESVVSSPSINIKTTENCFIYIDDDFNYSDGHKLIKNISGKKELHLPNQEDWISEAEFLKLAEEKVMNDLTYSVTVRKNPKNK